MFRLLLTVIFLISAPLAAFSQTQRLSIVEGNGQVVNLRAPAASIFVGDPETINVQTVSQSSVFISGVKPGTTNLIALDAQDQQIVHYKVIVRADISEAGATLGDATSGSSIKLDQAGNTVIIKGKADTYEQALAVLDAEKALKDEGRRVVNRSTTTRPNQVSLEVKFVEVSRSDLKRIGFNVGATQSRNGNIFTLLTGTGTTTGATGGLLSLNSTGNFSINAILEALESEGVVQILSEPTLTTVSGRRARFRSGGEFAFPINQGDGVISAEYKATGVSLEFLPTILPNNRMLIEVSPEVSFVDPSQGVEIAGFNAPSISVRRADTTVEVGSGQTFAIAGLYEQNLSDNSSGVPGFRGILGNRGQTQTERELVIFITPYLSSAAPKKTAQKAKPLPVIDRVGFILK